MKLILVAITFHLTVLSMPPPTESGITYNLKQSRFGDHVVLYCYTFSMASKYGLTLIYKPFPLSKYLAMDSNSQNINPTQFQHDVSVPSEKRLLNHLNQSIPTLYTINRVGFRLYTPQEGDDTAQAEKDPFDILFSYITSNKELKEQLRNQLKPIIPITTIPLSKKMINVAIHIRTGGDFDQILPIEKNDMLSLTDEMLNHLKQQYANIKFPSKFPPFDFYVQRVKKIHALYPHRKVFLHIFTDDTNPSNIAKQLKQEINASNIQFSYSEYDPQNSDLNVLRDFFSMTKFDILIRPESRFSQAAQLIGDFKMILN